MPDLFILVILACTMWFGVGFYWGYRYGLHRHSSIPPKVVRDYLDKQLPDKWTAYQYGVHEGYEQGLRDGQSDNPPEDQT